MEKQEEVNTECLDYYREIGEIQAEIDEQIIWDM